jgi:hypothetical protein
MKQYLGVLHRFEEKLYAEPGIKHSPTLEEQKKALNFYLQKHNGQLSKDLVIDDELINGQSGFDSLISNNASDGIIFFTIESLRKPNALIDVELLGRLHGTFNDVFIILESLAITSHLEFEAIASKIIVNNECIQRDSSPDWKQLVQNSAVSLSVL